MPQSSIFSYKHLVIIVLIFLSIVSCQRNPHLAVPVIENGVIDLKNWDFSANGPVTLQGEWKFIWNAWEDDFTSVTYDDSGWDTLHVPELWNYKTGTGFGYGCLRLTLKNVPMTQLGLLLQNAAPSYVMYVNGESVSSAGLTGRNRETVKPHMVSHVVALPQGDTLVISWYLTNYQHYYAGILASPVIGIQNDLHNIVTRNTAFDTFIMGIILIMGLYHFILWLTRRKDKENLFFALFSLVILIRVITVNYYPENLFPDLPIHAANMKLFTIVIGLAWLFYHFFLRKLFPEESPKKISIWLVISCMVALLFLVFAPVWLFTTVYLLYAFLLFFGIGYELLVIIKAVIKKREGSLFLLVGTFLLCTAAVNDVLHYYNPGVSSFTIHIAMVCFLFMKSVFLSRRFTHALRTSEYLTSHLHKEVAIKTQMIEKQNEKLRELDREKTDYLMNISHEIKTPLTLINNYLDKYVREKGPNKDSDVIKNSIVKLTGDVINFMDFEKLNRKQVFYNHNQIVCLSAHVEEISKMFRETAKKKKLKVHTDIQKKLYIKADPSAVERIVNNLIDNALKYSKDTGDIYIRLTGDTSTVTFAVEDSGIGIPENNLDKIFRPYYQISHKKRNTQGLGMGLPIIKKIIDELGSTIHINSVPEQGTTVIVVFQKTKADGRKPAPLSRAASLPVEHGANQDATKHEYNPSLWTILMVEDNEDMLHFLRSDLSGKYNIFEAVNGKDALDKVNLIPKPDLILSDIMMDEMDGYELLEHIRTIDEFKHIPFVFLTAKTAEEHRKKGLRFGAVDYIGKPFDVEELKIKIDAIINLCQLQKQESQAEVEERILNVIRNKQANSNVQFVHFESNCAKYNISEREKEVLKLIFHGKENKEIAFELDISYSTVATHFQSIMKKCNVQNKIDLYNLFRPKSYTD